MFPNFSGAIDFGGEQIDEHPRNFSRVCVGYEFYVVHSCLNGPGTPVKSKPGVPVFRRDGDILELQKIRKTRFQTVNKIIEWPETRYIPKWNGSGNRNIRFNIIGVLHYTGPVHQWLSKYLLLLSKPFLCLAASGMIEVFFVFFFFLRCTYLNARLQYCTNKRKNQCCEKNN